MGDRMQNDGVSRRILVTGAGGFVGTWLLRALAARFGGHAMVTATGLPRPETAALAQWVAVDLADRNAVNRLVAQAKPRAVVHLAGITAAAEAQLDPRRAFEVNVFGTMHLIDAVLRAAPTARFIHVGSSEAYGASFLGAPGPVDESTLLQPVSAYATSKAAADLLVGQAAHQGLRALRVRPFNHTGPEQSERFVIASFAAQIVRLERDGRRYGVIRTGNLDARRDFLDVRDVVAAYVEALAAPEGLAPGLVVNLASGVARRIGDALTFLVGEARCEVAVEADPLRMRPNDLPVAVGDATRARELLGWAPRIAWETTLRDILTAARKASGGPA